MTCVRGDIDRTLVVYMQHFCVNLNTDDSSKSVIYILSSSIPVVWNVRGERFHDLRAEIWVCFIAFYALYK